MAVKVGHSNQTEKRLRAFEVKICSRLLMIKWKERRKNEWVMARVCDIFGCDLEGEMEVMKKGKFKPVGFFARGGGTAKNGMRSAKEPPQGRP